MTQAGEYYYNGEGYDGEFSKANRAAMLLLLGTGQLAATDVMSTGRHYAALITGRDQPVVQGFSPGRVFGWATSATVRGWSTSH